MKMPCGRPRAAASEEWGTEKKTLTRRATHTAGPTAWLGAFADDLNKPSTAGVLAPAIKAAPAQVDFGDQSAHAGPLDRYHRPTGAQWQPMVKGDAALVEMFYVYLVRWAKLALIAEQRDPRSNSTGVVGFQRDRWKLAT